MRCRPSADLRSASRRERRDLPGASTNPDFDIAQLQADPDVKEHAFSGRVDVRISPNWSAYVRAFHDQGTNLQPEGVTGRNVDIEANPSNAVAALQGLIGLTTINELKVGYNAAQTRINGVAPTPELSDIVINLSGSVANTGIAGQGATTGLATPGGLVRANSATNGRAQPCDPYSLSFIDTMTVTRRASTRPAAGVRLIRMTTDHSGAPHAFANLNAFLANTPSTVRVLGDVSEPSVFNDGATGARHTRQE
ncbi:MAG: hypothetical protein R2712_24835 [Vicinamibacterales bacterium]